MRAKQGRKMLMIALSFFIFHLSFSLCACSESEDEDINEFGNWQVRNEAYFDALEDSLSAGPQWMKIKTYSKDENTAGKNTDYVYVKVLQTGSGTDSPVFGDSVQVVYRGSYIPTEHYPEGYVFDETYTGNYDLATVSVQHFLITNGTPIDGFATALLHMHKGDHWRVFIPYQLGYGASSSGVLAYSTLIFDLTLTDFAHPGTALPVWK